MLSGSQNYLWLVTAGLVSGVTQALAAPVTNQLIALFGGNNRDRMIDIKQSAVQFAQLLTGALLPAGALLIGWRSSTLVGIVLAAAGMLLIHFSVPHTPRVWTSRTRPSRKPLPLHVWRLAGYILTAEAGLQVVNTHPPLFVHAALGWSATVAETAITAIGAEGLVPRILVAVRLPDGVMERALRTMGLLAALSTGLLRVAAWTGHDRLIWPQC